ncbi:MAG: hypothetical protein HYR71_01355 [Chloroflexi bacterium]|nr:hypothetical protein [Chloroflexota bacterium]
MPRKIKGKKRQAAPRKMNRGEIVLYALGIVVALSMALGTLASAIGR